MKTSISAAFAAEAPRNAAAVAPPRQYKWNEELRGAAAESLQYESGFLGAVPERGNGAVAAADNGGGPSAVAYLSGTLSSKVYEVAIETPLQFAGKLSERIGVGVWLKREDLQPVFSFKLRGASNMMAKPPKEQLERGVICSSAGNHAQGVALSARRLGCDAVIAMPVTTPEIKWKPVEDLGAKVVLVGDSYDEAQAYAKEDKGPLEWRSCAIAKGPLHAIFVPVGGGGLIAAIAAYVKQVSPEVKIIRVEPADANAMALSLHHGGRVKLNQVGGFADGVAVKVVGEETFRLCREYVNGIVLVSRDAICASIKFILFLYLFSVGPARICLRIKGTFLEPAGALSLAGAEAYCKYYGLKGESVVAITSGANMNFDRLRLVTELANVGRQREAVLATYMPEEPGSFKRFSEMMGGRVDVKDELLYRFVFPERPGALMKFLDAFSPLWNISLFHYRAQGETGANVLVGIQVLSTDMAEFLARAEALVCDYTDEMNVTLKALKRRFI
ncbi:hypothetical protein Scep_006689 [Stephania cephalantha]|uniref:threonine ammonia-lyase n=1 Tax=Stephania cephalantha TaxID=152367 RepID=A0AAP0KAZ0_9MAGN